MTFSASQVRPRRPALARIAAAAVLTAGLASLGSSPAGSAAPGPTRVSAAPAAHAAAPAAERDRRPNVVLLSSDDQIDHELQHMPLTRRLLTSHGVNFTDGMNPHPLCCPARAEILSGEYGQNNGVHHNTGRYGGYHAFLTGGNREQNLGRWLHDAHYRTGFVGKMLNGYKKGSRRLWGWDYWNPTLKGTYAYYGTQFYNNGSPHTYRKKYVADVVRDDATSLIRRWSDKSKPFFIWASHVGPHASLGTGHGEGPPIPAHRDRGRFKHALLPQRLSDSFNEQDVSDKPAQIRQHKQSLQHLTRLYRLRLRTLQSIDRANAAVIRELHRQHELSNTVVVFVSDNGFQLGEHRLKGKNYVYQENLQIPFVMRGPQVPQGEQLRATATVVDLAPTFLNYAGVLGKVRRAGHTDGLSLLPTLKGEPMPNDTTLIQAGTDAKVDGTTLPWLWRGVRTPRYTYARWYDGTEELYDRRAGHDPYEMNNLVDPDTDVLLDPAYGDVLAKLRNRRAALIGCRGAQECEKQQFAPISSPD